MLQILIVPEKGCSRRLYSVKVQYVQEEEMPHAKRKIPTYQMEIQK